ncbi:MAG: chemoreceptor glutamine deamidase CheD [Betaproteobacteria bacterium]|nr:chemoreceptor glutamine deamidase CheD [Betaproteobacteria bacterium]
MRGEESSAVAKPVIYRDRHFNVDAAKIGPGEYYITQRDMVIVTVLGSCVSACMRDPVAKVGGMNHFMLPDRDADGPLSASARYGAYAMEVLINQLFALGAKRERLEAKVFGAARVLPGMSDIGERNAAFAMEYLKRESIRVVAEDLGHEEPCKIYFFAQTGRVLLKRLKSLRNDTIAKRERDYAARLERISGGAGSADLF